MKTRPINAFKALLCRLALITAALFAVAVLVAMAQGALALLPGSVLLVFCLPVLNALCGALAPAPQTRRPAAVRAVRPSQAPLHGAA